jgi:hypothetical protein
LETAAFQELKSAFRSSTFLIHHDCTRTIYINVDSSQEFRIGAMIYHVKKGIDLQPRQGLKHTDVEPILFLSRSLHTAEKCYWPTELKIAGVCWVIRKVSHMILSTKTPVQVFTDHRAITGIINQKSLETESMDRANLFLVRVSNYLQDFNLKCYYKSGKKHIVLDALSQLASLAPLAKSLELDFDHLPDYYYMSTHIPSPCQAAVYNFTVTLAEMSP